MDWLTIALLAIVGILILALLITYSKKYAWVKVFTIVLVLVVCVGSATYCGIQLNFYYNASGGIFGYIEDVLKPNDVKVEDMDFKIENIELTQDAGTDTYSARILIDKTLDFENEDNYGVFVNDIFYANVASNYAIVNYSYTFFGDNLEILLTDTLQINLAFNANSTSLTLKTQGGENAVRYWNYYFNKNNFVISIKTCDFVFDQNIDYGDGYEENMQNQIKFYQSKITEYENKIEELTNKLDDALEQGNLDKETITNLQQEIGELNNQVNYYKELLEAYQDSDKFIATYVLVDNGIQTVYDVQVVEPNGYLTPIETPEGDFEGWATEIGGEYIDDLTTIQVTENITIYGMFSNTVTFIIQDQEPTTQVVKYNGYATHENVDIFGYTFKGWSLDKSSIINLNEIPITKDTTFYAVLEERLYSIQDYETVKDKGLTKLYIFEPQDLVELSNIVNNSEEDFKGYTILLANDIDMQGISFTAVASANSNDTFSGYFDGQNYTISNLTSGNGLFANVSGIYQEDKDFIMTISNLNLKNINYENTQYVSLGGIVNSASGKLQIVNCHVTGNILSDNAAGGIVASIHNNTIIDRCSSKVNIEGYSGVGGIIGRAYRSVTITNCFNTGDIIISSFGAGGIVGISNDYDVEIRNSYNSGNIEASHFVGGLIGDVKNILIINCFNVGNTVQTNEYTDKTNGAIIGLVRETGNINHAFFTNDLNAIGEGEVISNQSSQIIENNLKTQEFYISTINWDASSLWDFENTWEIVNGNYPTLK